MREEILEAMDEKGIILSEMADAHSLYEALDYDGRLHEIIDSYICIYYYELRAWAVDNWEFVEEAIEEGLCEGVSDYHKMIQVGQYVSLRYYAFDAVESIYNDFIEEVAA
jgi:hypothetical protein